MTTESRVKKLDSEKYVEGYATLFDKPYEMYEYDGLKYYESVSSLALDDADLSVVILRYDHKGKVLARNSNHTLGVVADTRGLFVCADLTKSRAAGDLYEEIQNGLINKMSWAFKVSEESYDKENRTRKILKIAKVYDVSAVGIPASSDTDITARSYFDGVIEVEKREALARETQLLKLKINLEVLP